MPAPRRFWLVAAALVAVLVAGVVVGLTSRGARELPQADGVQPRVGTVVAPPAAASTGTPVTLGTAAARSSGRVIAAGGGDAPYNYGPAVLADPETGRIRLWWCSQLGVAGPPGDDILYAEATSANGPFRAGRRASVPVLSGRPGGFDAVHTCDPSVVVVDGVHYLYYTGAASDHAHGNSIGLATSRDGVHWRRANSGRPIVLPSGKAPKTNTYGAGQPAVVVLGSWFYLMYTDTTETGTGPNGAGQFVLRAHDPAFQHDPQTLTADGFQPLDANPVKQSIVDAFSADWMWSDALNAFAVAHETTGGTEITFLDRDLTATPYQPVLLGGPWQEGPGLVRRPDGHAVVPPDAPCDRVPLDVVRATANPAAPTNLVHFGLDLTRTGACGTRERALGTLYGFGVPSPQRTMDLVVAGGLVRVDRRSVAGRLAVRLLDRPVPALTDAPVLGHLKPGVPARAAPGHGFGLVLDGKLYRIPPDTGGQTAALNSSAVLSVTATEFDAYPGGATLLFPR